MGWMDCPPVSPGGGSEVPEALLEPGWGRGSPGARGEGGRRAGSAPGAGRSRAARVGNRVVAGIGGGPSCAPGPLRSLQGEGGGRGAVTLIHNSCVQFHFLGEGGCETPGWEEAASLGSSLGSTQVKALAHWRPTASAGQSGPVLAICLTGFAHVLRSCTKYELPNGGSGAWG